MINEATSSLNGVVKKTPLQFCQRLSDIFSAKVYLKREDLQMVRSFKIRGAYYKMVSLNEEEKNRGIVCASAGNHAQGVAYACSSLRIKGTIFMPVVTPNQKIEKVKKFGGKYVEIKLVGNTFDEAHTEAQKLCNSQNSIFVHPFDDAHIIVGQGTVGKEIYDELNGQLDVIVVCIGGGGLISGVSTYIKEKNPFISVIGAEPEGAAGMHVSLKNNALTVLEKIDTFVDGAAVKKVGSLTFSICKKNIDSIVTVPEGKVCSTMIELYQEEGIIAEPAGAVSVAVLDKLKNTIKGKTIVCVISGGNNDILRYPETLERSLVYQGRKHYFIINFAQKPGQLKKFVNHVMGPNDDIVLFEYIKKTNKEKGPALVGIEHKTKEDYTPLIARLQEAEFSFQEVTSDDLIYNLLVT